MPEDIATLGLKIDSSDIKGARDELGRFTKKAEGAERATDSLAGSATSLGKALPVAALAAATGAIVVATAKWRDFSAAISDLSAITGATGKDLEFLKQQSLAIGESTTLSASQAAEAFKLIASAKPDLLESASALAAVTRETVLLAQASGLDLATAAEAVGASLNQFGAGAEQAARFVNVLAAGSKFGASEINSTAEALREAGTVASSAGLSFEETNAAIQQLAGVSIKGSKAGVALRNAIVNLRVRGVDETNPAIVGMAKALENLKAEQLDTAELAKLFGKENLAAGEALLKTAGSMDTLTDKLTGTATAMEQARVKVDNLDGDIKKMGSAWEGVALELGESFDPALRASTQLITALTKPVKTAIIEFTDLGDALGVYAAIAASVATLDFDAAKAIIAARKEERVAVDKKIESIWSEKKATDELNESKLAAVKEVADEEDTGPTASQKAKEESDRIAALFVLDEEQLGIHQANQFALTNEHFAELEITKLEHLARMGDMDAQARLDDLKFSQMTGKQKTKAFVGQLIQMTQGAATQSKAMFKINQAAAVANAVISGREAVQSAYAFGTRYGGPVGGAAMAAIAVAATAANIKAITSASFGGGGGGGGGGGATTPSEIGQSPQVNGVPVSGAPVKQTTFVLQGIDPAAMFTGQQMRDLVEQIAENEDAGAVFV